MSALLSLCGLGCRLLSSFTHSVSSTEGKEASGPRQSGKHRETPLAPVSHCFWVTCTGSFLTDSLRTTHSLVMHHILCSVMFRLVLFLVHLPNTPPIFLKDVLGIPPFPSAQ